MSMTESLIEDSFDNKREIRRLKAQLLAANSHVAELRTCVAKVRQDCAEMPHGRSRVQTLVISDCAKMLARTPAQSLAEVRAKAVVPQECEYEDIADAVDLLNDSGYVVYQVGCDK